MIKLHKSYAKEYRQIGYEMPDNNIKYWEFISYPKYKLTRKMKQYYI